MARRIELAVLLLTLMMTACQPTDESADPSLGVVSSAEANEALASPLIGAWRVVETQDIAADGTVTDTTPQESLFLFTGTHYSMGYAMGEERFPPFSERWNPTETEQQERFSVLTVNAGTYELSGSRLMLHPQFALFPEFINGEAEFVCESSGDTLTLTWVSTASPDGVQQSWLEEGNKNLFRLERQQ